LAGHRSDNRFRHNINSLPLLQAVKQVVMKDHKEVNGSEETSDVVSEPKYIPGEYKLNSYNWLTNIPLDSLDKSIVEIRFKNTRKGFYRNVNNLRLQIGEIVAVEASPGHDIGRVSMVGRLVEFQLKQQKNFPDIDELKKVYRKAKPVDVEKWRQAMALEIPTMLKSRMIAEELGLNMKIGDVEYQGDNTKAIFYYLADERVDFRQLIRVLAENFRVRIEMRQIGARQEAGRIGGIGSCGRELCCTSYIKNFVSVTTAHAKFQELSLNPQKLAGQCSKLKCCLNYELDSYIDIQKGYPPKDIPLQLAGGTACFVKMEVFKGIYWYSSEQESILNLNPVPVKRVAEIQEMNKRGIKPERLVENQYNSILEKDFNNAGGDDSVTRFGEKNNSNMGRHRRKKKHRRNDRTK